MPDVSMETQLLQCATAGCGHSPFPISTSFIERAQRTHETFYCPAGHSNYFPQKSDTENEKLSERVRHLEGQLRGLEELRAQVTQLQDLRTRASRLCPWPGCEFVASAGNEWDRRALRAHMRGAHGVPSMAEVEEAQQAKA
jgi:hypothetical protein